MQYQLTANHSLTLKPHTVTSIVPCSPLPACSSIYSCLSPTRNNPPTYLCPMYTQHASPHPHLPRPKRRPCRSKEPPDAERSKRKNMSSKRLTCYDHVHTPSATHALESRAHAPFDSISCPLRPLPSASSATRTHTYDSRQIDRCPFPRKTPPSLRTAPFHTATQQRAPSPRLPHMPNFPAASPIRAGRSVCRAPA